MIEGTLKSTFLPDGILAGTRIMLSFRNGWYIVETRFQIFKRVRTIEKASKYYESAALGVF